MAKPEICMNCGSTAILLLKRSPNGRHCDNCGAGWFVITRDGPKKKETKNAEDPNRGRDSDPGGSLQQDAG